MIAAIAVVIIVTLLALHKELELTSFDPVHAEVIGLRPDLLRYILLILMALAVVAAVQAVGVVLTSALLVVPAATASLVTNRLPRMMLVSVGVSLFSSLVGLVISYRIDVSSGGAIVLSCIACFAVAWVINALRTRRRRRL